MQAIEIWNHVSVISKRNSTTEPLGFQRSSDLSLYSQSSTMKLLNSQPLNTKQKWKISTGASCSRYWLPSSPPSQARSEWWVVCHKQNGCHHDNRSILSMRKTHAYRVCSDLDAKIVEIMRYQNIWHVFRYVQRVVYPNPPRHWPCAALPDVDVTSGGLFISFVSASR